MGDNMHTTFVSFVVLLISRWTLVGGNCSKFSSDGTLHTTVEVDGVCYYGFINNFQYSAAETLCSSEWTQLPNFQNEATQEAVYAALGSQYGQHWLGLKKVSGTWQWWDPVSVTGTAMTSPRWEGGDSGDCAYSMTSNMGGKWKATSLTSAYNTVCQEAGVPATASESTTTTSAAVPTTSAAAPATPEAAPTTSAAAQTTSEAAPSGNCSKFSSDGTLHTTVEVDGVCYYGFINNFQYSAAETLCSSEWTQLPNFQNEATQEAVYAELGSQYGQHWLGLKKVSGTWQWWDPVSVTGTAMTSPRWEGGDSGDCAYSMTSNMGGKWKATSLTSAYNTVCQEAGVPATASESTTTTSATAPTTSAAAPTTSAAAPTTSQAAPSTPEAASSCSRTLYGGVEAARFGKRSTLIGVEETSLMTLTSATKCALVCVAQVSCCSFVFDVTTHACRHFRPTFPGIDVIPTSSEKCYSVV